MSNGGEWAEVFMEDRQSGAANMTKIVLRRWSLAATGAGIDVTVGDATGFALPPISQLAVWPPKLPLRQLEAAQVRRRSSKWNRRQSANSARISTQSSQVELLQKLTPPLGTRFGHNASDCRYSEDAAKYLLPTQTASSKRTTKFERCFP